MTLSQLTVDHTCDRVMPTARSKRDLASPLVHRQQQRDDDADGGDDDRQRQQPVDQRQQAVDLPAPDRRCTRLRLCSSPDPYWSTTGWIAASACASLTPGAVLMNTEKSK